MGLRAGTRYTHIGVSGLHFTRRYCRADMRQQGAERGGGAGGRARAQAAGGAILTGTQDHPRTHLPHKSPHMPCVLRHGSSTTN